MKFQRATLILCFFLILSACGQTKNDKSFETFNEGVSLSLKAGEENSKGNPNESTRLNKLAIDKFRTLFVIDSSHPAVRSSIGHCLYLDKQYEEAIEWFGKANRVNGDAAINYREMGLSKLSLGEIKAGKSDIDKAFSMDTTRKIREITIADLTDIGELADEYGDGYVDQHELEKGKTYKTFSIGVLMLAYDYDKSDSSLALRIGTLADKFGDKETAKKYKALAGK